MSDKQKMAENARKIISDEGSCALIYCQVCPCWNPEMKGCEAVAKREKGDNPKHQAIKICKQWLIDNPEV